MLDSTNRSETNAPQGNHVPAWSTGPEMKAETNKRVRIRSRRFRFSLRAMLIGVALVGALAAWVATQIRIVKQRRADLDQVISCGGSYAIKGSPRVVPVGPFAQENTSLIIDLGRKNGVAYEKIVQPFLKGNEREQPWAFRRLLGDPTVRAIILPKSAPDALAERMLDFPEADAYKLPK